MSQDQPTSEERQGAAWHLHARGTHADLPALERMALEDTGSISVEGAFVDSWEPIYPDALDAIRAIYSREGITEADVARLTGLLHAPDEPPNGTFRVLALAGEAIVPALRTALADPEPLPVIRAMQTLVELKDPEAGVAQLAHPSPEVRAAAIELRPEASAWREGLLERLPVEPDPELRKRIIKAATFPRTVAGARALLGCGSDPDAEPRRFAANELQSQRVHECGSASPELVALALEWGRQESEAIVLLNLLVSVQFLPHAPAAAEWLVSLLHHADNRIRERAARQLGRAAREAAAGPLLAACEEDENREVRLAALHSLAELEERRALDAIRREFNRRLLPGQHASLQDAYARLKATLASRMPPPSPGTVDPRNEVPAESARPAPARSQPGPEARIAPPYLHLLLIADAADREKLVELAAGGETEFAEWETLAPEGLGYGPFGAEYHQYDPAEPGWEARVALPGAREAHLHSISSRVAGAMRNAGRGSYGPKDWYDEEWHSDRRYWDEPGALERIRTFAARALEQRNVLVELGIRRIVPGLALPKSSWIPEEPGAAREAMKQRAQRLAGLFVEALRAPGPEFEEEEEEPEYRQIPYVMLRMSPEKLGEFKKAAVRQALAALQRSVQPTAPGGWLVPELTAWLEDPSAERTARIGMRASAEMWEGGVRRCLYPVDFLRPAFVLAMPPGITAGAMARRAVLALTAYASPSAEWEARRGAAGERSDRWQYEAAIAIRDGRPVPEPVLP